MTAACAGRSSSWLCSAILSVSNSFMATYCCDLIFCDSLAPIGGSAEDSTTAPCPGGFTLGTSEALSGEARLVVTVVPDAAFAAAAAPLIAEWLIENRGSPASDAGSGITPRGVAVAPAEGSTHQVGDRTG